MRGLQNQAIVDELRNRIHNGDSAVEAMRFLIGRLRLGPESRLVVIAYFRTAFGVQLQDASKLGAWDFFTGGTWSEQAINVTGRSAVVKSAVFGPNWHQNLQNATGHVVEGRRPTALPS